jgi:hypothetical protein
MNPYFNLQMQYLQQNINSIPISEQIPDSTSVGPPYELEAPSSSEDPKFQEAIRLQAQRDRQMAQFKEEIRRDETGPLEEKIRELKERLNNMGNATTS